MTPLSLFYFLIYFNLKSCYSYGRIYECLPAIGNNPAYWLVGWHGLQYTALFFEEVSIRRTIYYLDI